MNYSKAIFLLSDTARAVAVTYEDYEDADRTLFKTLDPDIKVGDYVVVETGTRHHMTVCKVMETDIDLDLEDDVKIKWIVGVVHRADFEEITQQEENAIAAIKKAQK